MKTLSEFISSLTPLVESTEDTKALDDKLESILSNLAKGKSKLKITRRANSITLKHPDNHDEYDVVGYTSKQTGGSWPYPYITLRYNGSIIFPLKNIKTYAEAVSALNDAEKILQRLLSERPVEVSQIVAKDELENTKSSIKNYNRQLKEYQADLDDPDVEKKFIPTYKRRIAEITKILKKLNADKTAKPRAIPH